MGEFLDAFVLCAIVFGPSFAAIVWFIISLVMYKSTDKSSPKHRTYRILAIVSGSIAGAVVIATAVLVWLFFLAMAHM